VGAGCGLVLGTLIGTLLACATSVDVPVVTSPISDELPQGVEQSIESRIEGAIPEVSYQAPVPQPTSTRAGIVLDPHGTLGPAEMQRLIRRLESLDGRDRIVCVPTRDRAFGECVFPDGDDTATP
jgi:hypothetical protein